MERDEPFPRAALPLLFDFKKTGIEAHRMLLWRTSFILTNVLEWFLFTRELATKAECLLPKSNAVRAFGGGIKRVF